MKKALEMTPILSPPDYSHEFLIYVVASQEMIGMVLVQEDEELHEHVIYNLSQNLIDVELHYTHVEKLALSTVHAVYHLRHFILLPQTFVIDHINPFQFVLTRRMIGGKYNKWIFILQEFDLKFVWMKKRFMRILLLMSISFSSQVRTLGTGILLFIWKH